MDLLLGFITKDRKKVIILDSNFVY